MALARWQAAILDEAGNALTGASIEVRREIAGAPLAAIFADRDGQVALGNPFPAQETGLAFFHAAGGAYRITASLGPFSRTWRYVGVGLNTEQDGGLSGNGAATVPGQLAVFTEETGVVLGGAMDSGEPPAPVLIGDLAAIADAAAVRASIGAGRLTADVLDDAAAAVPLVDAATVAIDWDAGIFFTLTSAGNRTIGNPVNGKPGQFRYLNCRGNDATDRTLIFGNQFLGELPTITDMDAARHYLLIIFCVTPSHFVVSAKVSGI